jgi:hypothetical protein
MYVVSGSLRKGRRREEGREKVAVALAHKS